jgi:hypothetical protein
MPTVANTINKVNSFGELSNGWHFGEGVSPSKQIRELAIKFLRVAEIMGINRTNAFPGVDGQIQVTFYHEDSMLEVTLEPDGSFTLAEDEGSTQSLFEEGASRSKAYARLREFSDKIWDSSESSTVNIMTRNLAGSLVRHLPLPAIRGSRLLRLIAPFRLAAQYAGTLADSIEIRLDPQPFTGGFQTIRSQKVARSSPNEVPVEMIATSTSTVGLNPNPEAHSSV